MLLRDKDWLISYSSNENNPIADFYIPALESAVTYDRKSGFFNSAILSKVAQGLGAMLYNEGKMREHPTLELSTNTQGWRIVQICTS